MPKKKKSKKLFPGLKKWEPHSNISPDIYFDKLRETGKDFLYSLGSSRQAIPAGYTYLGQFIAHELLHSINNPRGPRNRSHFIDLDSVYGMGPRKQPIFFNHQKNAGKTHFLLDEALIEHKSETYKINTSKSKDYKIYDLPRKIYSDGTAVPIIPDIRNDDNFIVSQLHVAIQCFHNFIADEKIAKIKINLRNGFISFLTDNGVAPVIESEEYNNTLDKFFEQLLSSFSSGISHTNFDGKDTNTYYIQSIGESLQGFISPLGESNDPVLTKEIDEFSTNILSPSIKNFNRIFSETKKETLWHFQWIVLNDFLPRIVGPDIMKSILKKHWTKSLPHNPQLKHFKYKKIKGIPSEFSIAAFRFGHSMIQTEYNFSRRHKTESGAISFSVFDAKKKFAPPEKNKTHLDWSLFFHDGTNNNNINFARPIDPLIDKDMVKKLPEKFGSINIVYRNLTRSYLKDLASGQSIAREMGVEEINFKTIEDDLDLLEFLYKNFPTFKNGRENINVLKDFCNDSPLWFYILLEAYHLEQGKHLGPVGGRIVAEVIIGLLYADKESYINASPAWKPRYDNKLKKDGTGDNSMVEFLKEAKVYKGAFAKK